MGDALKQKPITEHNRAEIDAALKLAQESGGYCVTIAKLDNSRKQRRRALARIWYAEISEELGWPVGYAEAYCKYWYGIKWAKVGNEELVEIYRQMLTGYTHEQSIKIIEQFPYLFPVLRDQGGMDARLIGNYLSSMQRGFAEKGVILVSSNEEDLLKEWAPR